MKLTKIVMAAVAAMLIASGAAAQTAQEVAEKFNKAAGLINNDKNYAGAIPVLTEVITEGEAVGEESLDIVEQAKKLLPTMYQRVGLTAASGKKYDEAVTNLEKALSVSKQYNNLTSEMSTKAMLSKVYSAMGGDAFNSKDYAKAAEIFSKGYAANPNDTDLALNLAMSYAEGGKLDEGMKVYKDIVTLGEKNSKYKEAATTAQEKIEYYQTIEVSELLQAKDYTKAIALLEPMIAETPGNATAQMMLLQAYFNQKKYDTVIQKGPAIAEMQTNAGSKSNAYFFIGASYQNKENNAKAIENYRKVTEGDYVATAKAEATALSAN